MNTRKFISGLFCLACLTGCHSNMEITARGFDPDANRVDIDLDGLATYGTLVFFEHAKYKGVKQTVRGVTGFQEGKAQSLSGIGVSSVEADLPKNIIVLMYDETAGRGMSCPLIANNNIRALDEKYGPSGFNDRAESWAWYRLSTARPPHAKAIDAGDVPEGTVEFFQDADLGTQFGTFRITSTPAATVYPMTGPRDGTQKAKHTWSPPKNDHARSVRWNLPERVLVFLCSHGFGEGRPIALWGRGAIMDLNDEVWAMPQGKKDGLSSVTWYDLR